MPTPRQLSAKQQILLAEYEVAAQAWRYEGETYWSTFNVLYGVGSAFLGLIIVILVAPREWMIVVGSRLEDILLILSVAGSVFSLVWFLILARRGAFYRYWIERLKVVEKELEYPRTLRGIGEYFDKMSWHSFYCRISVVRVSYVFPILFLVGYLSMNFMIFGMGYKEVVVFLIQAVIIAVFAAWGLKAHHT